MTYKVDTKEAKFVKSLVNPSEYSKSKAVIGNVTIYISKHFNWFQKLCWKLCFGVEVVDLLTEEKDDT